jgi:DNA adenine methylase
MILTRRGNKRRIAAAILEYFPEHKIYIEPFFGAVGMYFSKPKAKHNFVNDIDDDVFNLYMVIKDKTEEFRAQLDGLIESESLFKYWKKHKEVNDVWRAVRFVFKSNFSFLAGGNTFAARKSNSKKLALERIDVTKELLTNTTIMSSDFREFFRKISVRDTEKKDAFIYADPPYLDTSGYEEYKWKKKDTEELIETLIKSKIKFAISEFDNPAVIELACKNGLNIIDIGKRQNLKNTRKEILITNY